MRKVQQDSNKTVSDTTKPKDGNNPRRRKNKRQDEVPSEGTIRHVRLRRSKKKVLVPEGPRTFNPRDLRLGDKFTFSAPGKGKKTYICTVIGDEVLFERNDKHTYTRHLQEMPEIVRACNLVCTLING